jgi:hypothetical protein
MPRITHVKSARSSPGQCGCCSAKIKKGESYSWLKFRYGGRRVRCGKPACRFKRSDTTQSKLSTVYAAQEGAEEALAKWDRKDASALKEIVSNAAETVRDMLGEYEEQADEHPNLASQTEDIRSELESLADDLEQFDCDEEPNAGETRDAWAERVHGEAVGAIERFAEV